MATLSKEEICTSFAGCRLNMDHFHRCAHRNRTNLEYEEYIVYSCGFLYEQELRAIFGVTDKLKDLWERRGVEFNLCLYINDQHIVSCDIFKYTESSGARPSMTTPKCTQQELRIVRRILAYLVEA